MECRYCPWYEWDMQAVPPRGRCTWEDTHFDDELEPCEEDTDYEENNA